MLIKTHMYLLKYNKGFTLIELLVVIAIIALLSSVITTSLNSARKKGRDARRLADMTEIQNALQLYYDKYGRYPYSDYDGCGGWDVGNRNLPLLNNRLNGIMDNPPEDMIPSDTCSGYRYYRYGAGAYGCDPAKGAFYVLGVTDMETSGKPHPKSPGWSCPNRNWQNEFDWVTGGFEY